MSRIYLLFGQSGTLKTSLALTAQGKKWFAELDPGSYERADPYHEVEDVDLREYYAPPTVLEDMGTVDRSRVGASGHGDILISHRWRGWNEKFWEFIADYLNWTKNDDVPNGIIDTSSLLWDMAQNAFRQRTQEGAGTQQEKSDIIKRKEYKEPNSQLTSMIQQAKAHKKNLFMVAHRVPGAWENDKPVPGVWKADGWNEAFDAADVVLMTEIRNKKHIAIVQKAGGADFKFVGRVIEEPTHEKVDIIVESAAKLRKSGFELPDTNEQLVELAGSL